MACSGTKPHEELTSSRSQLCTRGEPLPGGRVPERRGFCARSTLTTPRHLLRERLTLWARQLGTAREQERVCTAERDAPRSPLW